MLKKCFIIALLFLCNTRINSQDVLPEENSLLMVHALFRHGERTTESFYPNDPYINNTFYPIGKGGLTNRGKNQEFKLGQFLRQRYDKFLGNVYSQDVMHIRSTGFLRTRMSALLVAAGLWPPNGFQTWNGQIPWQPIPVDYKPYEEDDLLNPGACLKRLKVLKTQPENEEIKKIFINPYKKLMEYLETNSGKPMKSPTDISELYLILKTEEDTNLTLPNWTATVYPEPLHEVASLVYKYFNFNPDIRKINAGYFFKKILNDFKSKINNTKNTAKIYLYSGHESTLGHILDVLKLKPHVSPYASVVLFELHKTKNTYIIKIFYKRGIEDTVEIEEIIYPGCENLCQILTFQNVLQDVIPNITYQDACKVN